MVALVTTVPAVSAQQGLPNGFEQSPVAGLTSVTAMDFAPDGRLFVAAQGGALRIIKDGVLLATPFMTIPVESFGEQGLLGLAFDPELTTNRYLYVFYTSPDTAQNRVSRFTASSTNPDIAEPGSELIILDNISHGDGYHNGGAIHFGSDGKLYIATGDVTNPNNAQSLGSLAGKLLRIDPRSFPNVVPPDNPFV